MDEEGKRRSALEAEAVRNRLEEEALQNLEFQAMQRVEELRAAPVRVAMALPREEP